MKRATLSVVLATFNEEKNLASTLESIKDIADEIVIVDGTSTDKTVEIAKRYKAKVKVTDNPPNFHINKQKAIDMATKDWILQLDADEKVSSEMKKEITEILEKGSEYNGYWMPRKNWFLGRFLMKGGQYPDYTLRFYRNGKGRLPQKDVHEQAVVEGRVGYLKEALLHYPYENLGHYLRKWNKYNDFAARQIKDELASKNILQKFIFAVGYLFIKPSHWLLTTFIRHKGFVDYWQGFVFSLFSALRFPASYIKYIGWYKVLVFLIILLAGVLRFYDFPHRWGLGGDDARDVMIPLEAIQRGVIPLAGPFSSAGPFVFGPLFYWLTMLSLIVLPFGIQSPWVMIGLFGVLNVLIALFIGHLIGGRSLSLILGFLTATSPQLVVRSLMLGPHTYVFTFASLAILSFILLWQKRMHVFSLLMGIFLGLGVSMHYQFVNLLIFFPLVLLIPTLTFRERVVSLLLSIVGFLIPSYPLLYWDSNQAFANTRNILDYLLIGQYRLYVPNSWTLFLFDYLPSYWSFGIGRFKELALLLMFLSGGVFIISSIRKKMPLVLFFLGLVFAALLIVNKFYKGERSEGYLLYLLPFILIFCGFAIQKLLFFDLFNVSKKTKKLIKYAGIVIFAVIAIGNFITIKNLYAFTSPVVEYERVSIELSKRYPGEKFSLHDYRYKLYDFSMGLSLILQSQGKISNSGIPIGLSCYTTDDRHCEGVGEPIVELAGNPIYDLRILDEIDEKEWVGVNQDSVYEDLIGWLHKNQLKSTFDPRRYIINKLGL